MARGCASRLVPLAVLLCSILFIMVEATSSPKKVTFDFDRHPGKNYFRFVLAASVKDDQDSTPVVIDLPDCEKYKDKDATVSNKHSPKTNRLSGTASHARDCQTFIANRTDMPAGFQVDNGGRTQTRIAITRIGPNALPWKFKVPELATSPPTSPLPSPKYTPEFAQIQDFDISRPDFQFEISCEKWWYQSEVHPLTPQYYGLSCQVKVGDGKSSPNICIGSENKDLKKFIDVKDGLSGADLVFSTCAEENKFQLWHLQSVAQEWPDYYLGQTDSFLVDPAQDPRSLFKACTQKGCDRGDVKFHQQPPTLAA